MRPTFMPVFMPSFGMGYGGMGMGMGGGAGGYMAYQVDSPGPYPESKTQDS